MNCRTFIVSSSIAILGSMPSRTTDAFADAGSLSVRATAGGPLVTPNGQFFVYSQMRNPAKLPS